MLQLKNIKRLRRRRVINVGAASSLSSRAVGVMDSQEKHIREHTRFPAIVSSLKEGISCAGVARWFAEQGWIDVNEKTFHQYLTTFKKRHPEIVQGGEEAFIDSIIDAHRPDVEIKTELNRLLRLQKLRLKIDVQTEVSMGKLFSTTVKEIEQAHKILETMAKIDGKISSGSSKEIPISDESKDVIRHLKTDEGQRLRMYDLSEQLVGAIKDASKETAEA